MPSNVTKSDTGRVVARARAPLQAVRLLGKFAPEDEARCRAAAAAP